MIPKQLTIEGLYSYQKRQTIDFSILTDAGIFGIFGSVGSGKSSILEAITFALYGNPDRLGAKDFSYNMMNLKSKRMYIEFDFLNHENDTYRIVREYRRNSKKFEKITNSGATLYKLEHDEWIPQEHTNVESIIGLNSDNFRRTIIIPQGKFQEFIQLRPTERTHMMKEIFNLHQYDLQEKVATLNSKNVEKINLLQGKLSSFEVISKEHIESLEQNLLIEEKKVSEIKLEFNQIAENFQQLKKIKEDFDRLHSKKAEFEQLLTRKKIIDEKKKQLNLYEKIYTNFFQKLEDRTRISSDLKKNSIEIENQKNQLTSLEKQFNETVKEKMEIEPAYNSLKIKQTEENDLSLIVQILNYKTLNELNKVRLKNGTQKVDEIKEHLNTIGEEIKFESNKVKELNQNKINSSDFIEIENWFVQQQNIEKSITAQQEKTNNLHQKVLELISSVPNFDIQNKDFNSQFNHVKKSLEVEKNKLSLARTQLEIRTQLLHYAHDLKSGEPCPLCGSQSHPSKITSENPSLELIRIDNKLKHIEQRLEQLKSTLSEKKFIEEQLNSELIILDDFKNQCTEHLKNFKWKQFDPNNFSHYEQKRDKALATEKEIEVSRNSIQKKQETLEIERLKMEKYTKELDKIKLDHHQKETQIQQNIINLKILNHNDFKHKNIEEVEQLQDTLTKQNLFIEKKFNDLNLKINDLNPRLSAHKKTIEIYEKYKLDLSEKLDKNNNDINSLLHDSQIESVEKVHTILSLKLDIKIEREEIEKFTIHFETLKNIIDELSKKLEYKTFNETIYETERLKLIDIEKNYNVANELLIQLKTEQNRLTKAYEEKKVLLTEMEQLLKRADNIKTMQNLFYKAGFVQYISSIYLKQLCENANIRFHRITNNQLSLQINENNDFEIIDYLNEGKSRSVKTLSGGQSFQVSLSLALALAESVQSATKSDKSFFFIDEGFGTQDPEAVNIIFETLLNLQKENRIVGIISHVEDLKDKIPVSLSITKNEETGSSVKIML